MKNSNSGASFIGRFLSVLDGRAITTWCVRLGIGSGTASRMRQGHVPGSDILVLMHTLENVRIDWLLTGTDPPFLARTEEDAELAELLDLEITDEPGAWTAHVCVAEAGALPAVVVLSQPGRLEMKGRQIEHRIVGVRAGAAEESLGRLADAARAGELAGPVYLVRLPARELQALGEGQRGTYALFGEGDGGGLLREAQAIEPGELRELGEALAQSLEPTGAAWDHCSEEVPDYGAADALTRNIRRLSATHQQVARATVVGLLEAEGREWED